MAEELFPLDNTVRNFLQLTGAASESSSRQAGEVAKKYQQAAESTQQAATSAVAVQKQKDVADLEAQQATRKAASAAGVDPTAAADAVFETLSAMKEQNKKLLETARTIEEKQSVRPHVDGIGAWISARASVGWDEQRLKGQLGTAKVLHDQLSSMNQLIQQSSQTYNAIKEPITSALIDEKAKIVKADADERLAKLAAEGFKYNLLSISEITGASKDQMQALFQLKSAKNADTQLELSIHNSRRQDEVFDWQKEQRAIEREAKKENKTVDAKTLEYINASERVGGVPLTTAEDFAYQMKIDKKNPNLEYHLQNGRRLQGVGVSGVGATPLESLENIKNYRLNIPDIQQETAVLIQQMEQLVQKSAKPLDMENYKKNPRAYEDAVTKQTQAYMKGQYQTIRPGSVLDVGDLKAYIGTSKEQGIRDLFSLPLSQKVLLPLADAGQPLNDVKQILILTTAAIQRGDISSSEAASGLSQIYRKASTINILARGLNGKFGFGVPDNGAKYNVSIGGFLSSQNIDMNNSTSLNSYFASRLNKNPFVDKSQDAQDEALKLRFGVN